MSEALPSGSGLARLDRFGEPAFLSGDRCACASHRGQESCPLRSNLHRLQASGSVGWALIVGTQIVEPIEAPSSGG